METASMIRVNAGEAHSWSQRTGAVSSIAPQPSKAGDYAFFFRAAVFRLRGFSGAGVVDAVNTTRGDTKVRTPCASNSMTVWYSLTLLTVPSPYWVCATRSPVL